MIETKILDGKYDDKWCLEDLGVLKKSFYEKNTVRGKGMPVLVKAYVTDTALMSSNMLLWMSIWICLI